ncbi:AraC-type DNA-binding protein [Flavobacterium anhuiense]|uniref:AraC-type DNA-binding protein n=1 Tax=Flavobacterium anhuiense TaxID=459526 RepID=A0ABY0LX45_9FLAO|nr:helix-turn-helix domain-containing protein [Flavobacterium anhuiense]SCY75357.1 AraC-type DNA-binding protein [Flavobacterium anhuiense]
MMEFSIEKIEFCRQQIPNPVALYQIIFFKESAYIDVDLSSYRIAGNTLLFLSPYQQIEYKSDQTIVCDVIFFHGDFYCIEYHKKEVACNGLLFNNIYIQPHVSFEKDLFTELLNIRQRMFDEMEEQQNRSDSVLKAYLQVILALASKEKSNFLLNQKKSTKPIPQEGQKFQKLLDEHFLLERSVKFYADQCHLSAASFSKKIKNQLGMPPTYFVVQRILLEAKKLLHLTQTPIKEISRVLQFEDVHYFSRFFKKNVGVSPTDYRLKVGISIVAK